MRQRHAWPGVLLLGALVILVGSLLLWGDHFLTPSPAGGIRGLLELRLLRLRLVSGVSTEASSSAEALRTQLESDASSTSDLTSSSAAVDHPGAAEAGQRRIDGVAVPVRLSPAISLPMATHHQVRYALALGSFAQEDDAERAEARLNQAGISTVRFRQQAPERLFSVAITRQDGGAQTATNPDGTSGDEPVLPALQGTGTSGPTWVAKALPLRSAVTLGERLKASGYGVRIVGDARRAGQIALRHGNFTSRQEAETASRQIAQLGVANEVVTVK